MAMRKAQKKQAEDFVELLGQAHDEIRKEIEKKNIPTVLSLLADCQEGAMSLGELIEKTEGEDAATIPLLERYCEEHCGMPAEDFRCKGRFPVRGLRKDRGKRHGILPVLRT